MDQGDDNATGCLLDYHYFKENCKLIVIDLNKQQVLSWFKSKATNYF